MSDEGKYNHSRFMKNYWKARLCHEREFLHVGRDVDHNHCEYKPESDWRHKRVSGKHNHPKHIHNKTECPCRLVRVKPEEEREEYSPDSHIEPPFGIRRDGYGKGGHRHG